jgi:RNA polymerase sigma-70 factor (sigma-E family)
MADEDFAAYVAASGPRLKRLAFLLTGEMDSAEDLLQTAYAKVLPRWNRIGGYDDPDAYLRRVMVNTRTSAWRRRKGNEVLTADVPERQGIADLTAAADDREDLRRALTSLPHKQRAAVVLRHYCDLSEAETATAMGVSVGTVKSQTSRGLHRLRDLVGATNVPVREEQV